MLKNLNIPKYICPESSVATVTLSWGGPGTFPEKYQVGKKQLEKEFNIKVLEMPLTLASPGVISDNPKARAEDLMNAFRDNSIKGIFSTIGGQDSIRLLPFIDFDIIRNNPKPFIGYSDTTVTHFMCLKAGVRSFYGPSIMAGFAENGGMFPYMKEHVRKSLFSNEVIGELLSHKDGWVVDQHPWEDNTLLDTPRKLKPYMERAILQGTGVVKGRLIGGCMEVLEMIKGTSIWPELEAWKGSIVFFETSEIVPSPEQISWWLRNYAAQGILNVINGIIIGRPGGCVDLKYMAELEKTFLQVVNKECGRDIPILSRLDFGHTDPQFVLPYGALAQIDCNHKSLSILEPGCH